jgi:hypothetical protein
VSLVRLPPSRAQARTTILCPVSAEKNHQFFRWRKQMPFLVKFDYSGIKVTNSAWKNTLKTLFDSNSILKIMMEIRKIWKKKRFQSPCCHIENSSH